MMRSVGIKGKVENEGILDILVQIPSDLFFCSGIKLAFIAKYKTSPNLSRLSFYKWMLSQRSWAYEL